MIFRLLCLAFALSSGVANALPEEEKKSMCAELGLSVLPVQRVQAINRCVEFAGDDCARIERSYLESCLETSHLDNAIKFDIDRGTGGACDAALQKRETQKNLCETLRRECRELSIPMGNGGLTVNCGAFRNDDNRKICGEIDKHTARIVALALVEKEKCSKIMGPATTNSPAAPAPVIEKGKIPTTSHGSTPSAPAPVLPKKFSR